jgi:hypothetical protein
MIEVVVNSDTISNIHKRYGGVMGALKSNTIWQYLKEKNIDPQSYEIATENFLKSCAGYCVTTYILGKIPILGPKFLLFPILLFCCYLLKAIFNYRIFFLIVGLMFIFPFPL